MGSVTVKSKFGQLGTVDDSDLTHALQHGFKVAGNDEIDEYNSQMEHGSGLINPLIAGAEEAASTATFGLSRQLENATGITTPEAQEARAKYNPTARIAGTVGGLLADPFGAIGLTSKIGGKAAGAAGKIIGEAPAGAGILGRTIRNAPAAAIGAATEGAAFGAGQSVADSAMGDPDALGEHLIANIGYGSLIAGGLGGALEGGGNIFGKSGLKRASPSALGDINKAASFKNDIADSVAARDSVAPLEAQAANQPFSQFPNGPQSLEDVQQAVKTNFPVLPEGLPSHNALKEAVADLPDLQFKPHNLQYESLTDHGMRDYYKTFLEGQTEESKALRDYEALQKAEATSKLDTTIEGISPGVKLSPDPVTAGNSVIDAFSSQYDAEKEALAPLFKQFDKAAEGKKINALNPLLGLHDVFPGIGEYLSADAEGVFKLEKYTSDMPFSKNTYGAIKDLASAANKDNLTLSGLRNVRESMRDRITLAAGPRDQGQIGAIRKMLMDQMQEGVSKLAPDLNVRETFKRYAQNEEKRAALESIMGGSLSDSASLRKTIKPEDVLDKLFSNTVSVSAAKDVLGKDFSKVMGDYLAQARAKVTDEAKNGFSSNKFATFLRKKAPELQAALADNPALLKRLNSLTDYMRILPDSPSVNPSGTAKTLSIMDKIADISRVLKPTNAINDFAEKFAQKAQAEKQKYTIGEVLAGKHLGAAEAAADERYLATSKLAKLERMAEQTAYHLKENAKAIFTTAIGATQKSIGVLGSKLGESKKKKIGDQSSSDKASDVFARIQLLNTDPDHFMDTLQKSTASIYDNAPMISQGVQTAAVRATQYLGTKVPPTPPKSAFSNDKYTPSATEIAQFEHAYNVIEHPIGLFDHVKMGTIVPEQVEALSTVYPKLYEKMKITMLNQAADFMKTNDLIPFQKRQAMSIFLGEPLDQALSPLSIMQNQMVFQATPQKNEGPVKPTQGGLSKIDLASRTGPQPERAT